VRQTSSESGGSEAPRPADDDRERRAREREMPTSDSGIDTIEEVLEALDTIIARALEEGSRVGYFAAVYRVVTAKIAEGIATGFFDDGERMQRLDVTFADRYLSALSRYQTGGMATKSWELASRRRPLPACRLIPLVEYETSGADLRAG
jgi:hypothetical protein